MTIWETKMIVTKVRYTKSGKRAVINMDKDKYRSLCDGYNELRSALTMIMEANDLYLSDIRNLEKLSFDMQCLGFERGEHYWNNVTIPKEKENEKIIK